MNPICAQLRDVWIAAGFDVNSGADAASIARFEQKRSVVLPPAFKDYLMTVNGMSDGLMDDELLSFHSLERIDGDWEWNARQIGHDESGAAYVEIVIADHSINCHMYVLRVTEPGAERGVWATHEPGKRLATSFDDFISAYLSSPQAIVLCGQ